MSKVLNNVLEVKDRPSRSQSISSLLCSLSRVPRRRRVLLFPLPPVQTRQQKACVFSHTSTPYRVLSLCWIHSGWQKN